MITRLHTVGRCRGLWRPVSSQLGARCEARYVIGPRVVACMHAATAWLRRLNLRSSQGGCVASTACQPACVEHSHSHPAAVELLLVLLHGHSPPAQPPCELGVKVILIDGCTLPPLIASGSSHLGKYSCIHSGVVSQSVPSCSFNGVRYRVYPVRTSPGPHSTLLTASRP